MSAGHRSKLEVSFLLVEHGARINENNIHGVRPVDLEQVCLQSCVLLGNGCDRLYV